MLKPDTNIDIKLNEFISCTDILGFEKSFHNYLIHDSVYSLKINSNRNIEINAIYSNGNIMTSVWVDDERIPKYKGVPDTTNISTFIRGVEKIINKYTRDSIITCAKLVSILDRDKYVIEAGISTRDLMRNLVRVKSSNMWGMAMDVKSHKDRFGDVIVQFKGKSGGPDDVYQYFDVPVDLYRRWITATSKGHFFWQYIRNNFKYRKLTGDKRGKLPNAIN